MLLIVCYDLLIFPQLIKILYNYYLDVRWGSTKNGKHIAKLSTQDK